MEHKIDKKMLEAQESELTIEQACANQRKFHMAHMITEYRAEIGALANDNDDETAHQKEDEIVWAYIAYRAKQGCELAQELLLLQDLDFERWYA